MSKLLVVGLALVAFTGCRKKKEEGTVQKPTEGVTNGSAGSAAPTPPPEKTLTGADLATKYQSCVALINDSKFDDFKKTCAADSYVMHDYGADRPGLDAAIGFFTAMKKAMPDWKLVPQIVVVSGRNIYAVELITGTNTGPLEMPMLPAYPATGKKIGQLMFHKLAINDQNRATEEWAFDDPTTTMSQLGLAPKDAPPARPLMDKGLDGAPIIVVTADNDAEKKNLATWKAGADALNAHKIPDILAVVADNAVESDQTDAKDNVGKKEIEAGLKLFLGGFSDLKSTTSESVAAGDYVVSIGRLEGTNDHDLGKMKKTGKKISLDVAEVSHFDKDGKVDHTWRFHSGMQFAMEMGLMPIPIPSAAGSAAAPAAAGSAAPAAGSAAGSAVGSAAPAKTN